MAHPLVDQVRFTRNEWSRALNDLTDEDARRRFLPMNCISWIVGHLAWQENLYWFKFAQGQDLAPDLDVLVGNANQASTPPLDHTLAAWHRVTESADIYPETLTEEILLTHYPWKTRTVSESIGTLLQRVLYHYWYHTGEIMAIRQMLGHTNLPEFVGRFPERGIYRTVDSDKEQSS